MIGTEFDLTPGSFLVRATEPEFTHELARERSADLRLLPTFRRLLALAPEQLGIAVTQLVAQIMQLPPPIGILSLARGGIPIGTLLARIASRFRTPVKQGILGWVRDETGPLDDDFLACGSGSLVVVDGWTGTGDSIREVRERWAGRPMVTAALSDPAGVCDIVGTHEDVLCPHALMQSALSWGLGRVRRLRSGVLIAPRDDQYPEGLHDEYHRSLLQRARLSALPVHAPRCAASRSSANPAQQTRADRSETRLGINECWRAAARNELAQLVVNPRFADEHDVVLLLDHHAGPVRELDLGALRCACLVRPASRMLIEHAVSPVGHA